MTEQEHLGRIKSCCEALLEGAKKRTPGEWDNEEGPYVYAHIDGGRPNGEYIMRVYCSNGAGKPLSRGQNTANAAFIASCAGPAEAGWKSTIAACKRLCGLTSRLWTAGDMQESQVIIAAWPVELL